MKDRLLALKTSGRKIASLTAYDYPTARLLDEAGVDLILVGDSLGMVVLGHPDTTRVTLDDMIRHGSAVAAAVKGALVVVDLPKNTYLTPQMAAESARRIHESTGAQAVKLEGGEDHAAVIAAIVRSGIPVVGHIGMLPQRIQEEGGYRIKGKTPGQADALEADAVAVEAAGACAVVLELVVPEVAQRISKRLSIPTIGIGSGDGCDGQVRVVHDIIGLYPWFRPKFVTPLADVATDIRRAAKAFSEEVRGAVAGRSRTQ